MDLDALRRDLLAAAHSYDGGSALRRGAEHGELVRVHRGWFVPRERWERAYTEERHAWQMLAVHASRRSSRDVFVRESAAVLWGLPLFRWRPDAVHIASARADGVVTADSLVARHRIELAARDLVERDGIGCTSLERTVVDVARMCPLATGVACADAALRRVAWDEASGELDEAAAEELRERMIAQLGVQGGARGIRRARFVVAFADARADRPGESMSRLALHAWGFAPPRLQVEIPRAGRRPYRVDFGLDEHGAWGEFDGEGKYAVDGPAGMAERVRAEKEREDWIRGTTGRRIVRWGMADLRTLDAFAERLAAFGIRPPARAPRVLPW